MSFRFPLYVLCAGFCVAAGMSFAFGTPDTLFGLAIGWLSQTIARYELRDAKKQ